MFLEARGYMLRPRYCPGWTPSWRAREVNPDFCEDAIILPVSFTHDNALLSLTAFIVSTQLDRRHPDVGWPNGVLEASQY